MIEQTGTAVDTAQQVREGKVSAVTATERALERARAAADLNLFITLDEEGALEAASRVDEQVARGRDPGPLAGVPIALKDNILTEGLLTTAASESLAHFIPPFDATVVARLRAAGAVVLGKTNMDEFGMGSSNENSAYGPARNPWDRSRVPGGSSGGSAAAVAAGIVPLALGTDTGGSVRQPAAFCGVIGLKPTYGALSRHGVIAFASSLDQVGIISRNGADATLLLAVLRGVDPLDSTTLPQVPGAAPWGGAEGGFRGGAGSEREARVSDAQSGGDRLHQALAGESGAEGLRVGLVRELSGEGNSEEQRAATERTAVALRELGATVEEVELPTARHGVAAYYLVATAEASSNLARFDGMIYSARHGEDGWGQARVMMESRGRTLGREVRRRVLMGSYALSAGYYDAYYGKALKVRRLIAQDFERAFASVDLLLTPTTPDVAFPLGERKDDPLAMYLGDVDTCLPSLAGLPAVSVPAGRSGNGLPCGVQFIAPPLAEDRLMAVSAALEAWAGDRFSPIAPSD